MPFIPSFAGYQNITVVQSGSFTKLSGGASPACLCLDGNGDVYLLGDTSGMGILGSQKHDTPILVDTNCVDIACGDTHILVKKANGDLYGFGTNVGGNLNSIGGNGSITGSLTLLANNVNKIFAGFGNSFYTDSSDNLYGTGRNAEGQLGKGDNLHSSNWTLLTTNVVDLDILTFSTIIIKSDNTAFGSGDNNEGQLGLGDLIARNTFEQISGVFDKCAVGSNHSILKG